MALRLVGVVLWYPRGCFAITIEGLMPWSIQLHQRVRPCLVTKTVVMATTGVMWQ